METATSEITERSLLPKSPQFCLPPWIDSREREFLERLSQKHHLTVQQARQLSELSMDLLLWKEQPLSELWNEEAGASAQGKQRVKAIISDAMMKIQALRSQPTRYDNFNPELQIDPKPIHVLSRTTGRLLGRCPCPVSGEKTRCCNLRTLDAVKQCGFGCSYCSIQSFYHGNRVEFSNDLAEYLANLQLEDDIWHIGTGQSSDSLLWGDDHGVLSTIAAFADSHPGIVLELKTKSDRTDWLGSVAIPPNMIASWSMNAPTIIEKEEHLTATLEQRLAAARIVADAGILVGFHLHPLVWFDGWEKEYRMVVRRITDMFDPSEVAMISLGTLTFSRHALTQLRQSGKSSRILQMELVETAGKYSYPVAVKQKLFPTVAGFFPETWKTPEGPFFYLCMELPELWEPTFGRSYPDNALFEADMRTAYLRKIQTKRENRSKD